VFSYTGLLNSNACLLREKSLTLVLLFLRRKDITHSPRLIRQRGILFGMEVAIFKTKLENAIA
jgi:hypothetical protein